MRPEDVIISPAGTGSTEEEIQMDCMATREELQRVYPFLDELAEAWKALEEGPAKDAAWVAYTALDAKRCELDDHLAAQNTRLRNL